MGSKVLLEQPGRLKTMPRIAYLTSQYPAVSHTFIQREILALRKTGAIVETFSIRRPPTSDLRSAVDEAEYVNTFYLLPPRLLRLLWAHVTMLLIHRQRYLRALWTALRSHPPGLRAAIWQLFYFCEATILASELHQRGIGHVHAHFANVGAAVARLASQMLAGTWSITLHGLADFGDPSSTCLAEKIRSAAFVVCVSDFGRAQAMLHSPPEMWPKIRVIRCGVDTERFAAPSDACQNRALGPIRLLNVARLGPEKGHIVLLQALQQVSRQGIDVACTIVGDGAERPRLECMAQELRIADRVTFAGAVGQDEIQNYYRVGDVFVLPSFGEGLPVVLMEAMAQGLPVIASHIMGIPELVQHDVHGLLVPPGHVGALAEAIIMLAQDADLRGRMGAEGREKVCREFDVRRAAERLAELFAMIEPGTVVPKRVSSGGVTFGAVRP